MEVILIQDLANLGFKGDIVKVRDGYGRNYLLPQKIAIIANESNKKQLAYPIQGKNSGFYFILQFDAEPAVISTLET